ncbi:esterase-like activity of phytase family protein [Caulobacter hibisci]|uniref:Esterase-like activity of phytase family protein n=1 Tax=Caulobacter hibisci TaxID=2035993 RepID=A0ABS0T1L8_9CAUL|nr:esterase-like activity of phytase family protein [Caulobacter hibisci]MBI1685704.1 esterase-like activity of phytase family protein [Caulobacter hibisci]
MKSFACAASLLALLAAAPAVAAPAAYRTPDTATPTGVTLNGASFVNHGLVGAGRLTATARDFLGDSLGSFSGMAVTAWSRAADGSYTGKLLTLPDRGPNGVGSVTGTTPYDNRVHGFDVTFRPLAAGYGPAKADQLTLTPTGGFVLKDDKGHPFTGMDPGEGVVFCGSAACPSAITGPGAFRISLDGEALARLPDGDFYVGDEYAANLYRFDATGALKGVIAPVAAVQPRKDGRPAFSGETKPKTGRRINQGFEGVAVSADGKRLYALLQSATIQDSGEGDADRAVTRLFVYDIEKDATPAAPIAEYALELPVVRTKGDGGAPNKVAAQSELLALSDHQFLVLARDGAGLGSGSANPTVYRSVLLVDIQGATNLVGDAADGKDAAIAPGGALPAGVVPAAQAQLVNLVDPKGPARVGLNLDNAAPTAATLPEKMESLAIVPALDPAAPNDVFLLIGSDNDFQTKDGKVGDLAFDAAPKTPEGAATADNDSLVLVYRLTLPADLAAQRRF